LSWSPLAKHLAVISSSQAPRHDLRASTCACPLAKHLHISYGQAPQCDFAPQALQQLVCIYLICQNEHIQFSFRTMSHSMRTIRSAYFASNSKNTSLPSLCIELQSHDTLGLDSLFKQHDCMMVILGSV
jgi:hypothetical protein